MAQDVEVAIAGLELEKNMLGAVPLVDHVLHEILVVVQPKANGPLFGFATGVTLDLKIHGLNSG
jgi:hypothetical protein